MSTRASIPVPGPARTASLPVGVLAQEVRIGTALTARITPAHRRLAVAVAWLVVLVTGLTLVARAAVRAGRTVLPFDAATTVALAGHRERVLIWLFRGIAYVASPPALTATVAITAILLALRERQVGPIWFGAFVLLAGPIESVVKVAVHRARPPLSLQVPGVDAFGSSFPSGHATQSAAVYGAIAVLCCRRVALARTRRIIVALTVLAVLTVAFSRVYLGVHWVSDVIAGMILGSSWLLVVVAGAAVMRRSRQ